MLLFLILLLSLIPLTTIFAYLLFRRYKSLKIDLRENERIIKEDGILYQGRNMPMAFFLQSKGDWGKLYVTNQRIFLRYWIFLLQKKLEIPLNKVRSIDIVKLSLYTLLKISYTKNGKLSSVYFCPFSKKGRTKNLEKWKNELERIISEH